MDQKEREALAKRIKAAFADAEVPKKEDFSTRDKYVVEPFIGKSRDEIGLDNLQSSEPLGCFFPTAFRYYLPIFLNAVVLHPYEVDVLADGIIIKLSPLDSEDFKGTILEDKVQHLDYRSALVRQTQLFSQQENQAIYEFLKNYERIVPDGLDLPRVRAIYERGVEFWKEKANG